MAIIQSTFPIEAVREAFPALGRTDGATPRVYLDNPAGTQVPRSVADAIARCMLETNANLGGYFSTSIAAEAIVIGARRAMADFLGAASEREIVIGPSMTSLTFSLSRSLAHAIQAGDEIVVTRMDHDGNITPWLEIAKERGATVRWVPFDRHTWTVTPVALSGALSKKTRIVALNYASNLTGSINDVRALCELARQSGALTYVDAVQYAPHDLVDVAEIGCDFLACSSYKFFGPHLGIVWGRERLLDELYAYKVRPQSGELPWKFEVGTPQIELEAGLIATVEYFEWLGAQTGAQGDRRDRLRGAFATASAWESQLVRRLLDGLETINGITIAGITDRARIGARVPTVSFTHASLAPSHIARELGRRGIFVWSGHNFALEVVRSLGIDEEEGVVRIGLAHYNTAGDVDAVLQALREI